MNDALLHDDFSGALDAHWRSGCRGNGRLDLSGGSLRLISEATSAQRYSNAQIDDYQGLRRRDFLWSPPLILTVRARFSHPAAGESALAGSGGTGGRAGTLLQSADRTGSQTSQTLSGTTGFGFWNDPFAMTGKRIPALPQAIWFFYASPPSNMKLALHTPGWGWKAATIDMARWPFLLLAPTIPLSAPLMRWQAAYRRLWPIGQRAVNVSEATVQAVMTEWHTYALAWGRRRARFTVDGAPVLDCTTPPKGPLGLVIWLDNQSLVITPQGRLRHSLLAQPGVQWLEIESLTIESQ